MEGMERAPRTVKTIKEIVRQVYNFASDHGWYTGPVPYRKFLKKQILNNQREAYYTFEQAQVLLEALKGRFYQVYCISLLSLNTGMRFGEIAGLLWQHIDLERKNIFIADPKNNTNHVVHMTSEVYGML